jgi:hypothetical protein
MPDPTDRRPEMSLQSSKLRVFATAAIGLFLAFIPVSMKAEVDRADADRVKLPNHGR